MDETIVTETTERIEISGKGETATGETVIAETAVIQGIVGEGLAVEVLVHVAEETCEWIGSMRLFCVFEAVFSEQWMCLVEFI